VLTGTLLWSLSWDTWIHFTSRNFISPRSILISSRLCLDLLSGLFPSDFPSVIIYATHFHLPHACYMSRLFLSSLIWSSEKYMMKVTNYGAFRMQFLRSPVSLSLLGLNILLSTPFSNTSVCARLTQQDRPNLKSQTSCSLYSSDFTSLDGKRQDEMLWNVW
jgi:hypothetical protein